MWRCVRWNHSVRHLCRQALSWRTARLFCAAWFMLTSVGLPMGLSQFGESSCAQNPGTQCRCSLTKRLSGTCCCRSEASQQLAKSCCSVKKSAPKVTEQSGPKCCSSKAAKHELSIARCDCPSDSSEGVSLTQEPRSLASVSVLSLLETQVALVALPVERVESALLLPPVLPPKVVL